MTANASQRTASNAGSRPVAFKLNGHSVEVSVLASARLSTVLREALGCKGTKIGCNAGDCGACSILLNNELVCACMVPMGRLDGAAVVTIEGLRAYSPHTERLQRAFHAYGATQCGICTPGMLISAVALLERKPHPSEEEVEDALGGVLCRCTGYRKIVRAVCDATDFVEADENGTTPFSVGRSVPRLDGRAKLLGEERFGDDVAPPGSLVLSVIRSPYHRAHFEFGDLKAFLSVNPGLQLVLTAADVVGDNAFGVIPAFRDQPVFADKVIRYAGEAIAAIVGDAATIENFDLARFPVAYTELPPLLDTTTATRDDATLVHPTRQGNKLTGGLVQRGDLEDGFRARRGDRRRRVRNRLCRTRLYRTRSGLCTSRGRSNRGPRVYAGALYGSR